MNSTNGHIRFEEQAAAYSLGVLDTAEKAEFEAHLRLGCPACEAELEAFEKTAATFAHAAPSQPLPDGLKEKVLATIEPERPKKTVPARPEDRERISIWPKLAFGFGITASLLATWSGFSAHKMGRELQKLTVEINALRQQLNGTQARLAFALSPLNEVLVLAGQPPVPESRGKIVWNPERGHGIFAAAGLAPLPTDKSYQLWVIAGGKPLSLAVFNVDSAGSAEIRMADLPPTEQINAFAVTLEPAGGMPQPTGRKYLLGMFGRI